jgi:hypothetical protein
MAYRSGNGVDEHRGWILYHTLDVEDIVQTMAETVVGVKYQLALCKA